MVPIYHGQEAQVNFHNYNEDKSSLPSKHIQFESSLSLEEEKDGVPEAPPTQKCNDVDIDYFSKTPPHDRGNVSLARTPTPTRFQNSLFLTPEAP